MKTKRPRFVLLVTKNTQDKVYVHWIYRPSACLGPITWHNDRHVIIACRVEGLRVRGTGVRGVSRSGGGSWVRGVRVGVITNAWLHEAIPASPTTNHISNCTLSLSLTSVCLVRSLCSRSLWMILCCLSAVASNWATFCSWLAITASCSSILLAWILTNCARAWKRRHKKMCFVLIPHCTFCMEVFFIFKFGRGNLCADYLPFWALTTTWNSSSLTQVTAGRLHSEIRINFRICIFLSGLVFTAQTCLQLTNWRIGAAEVLDIKSLSISWWESCSITFYQQVVVLKIFSDLNFVQTGLRSLPFLFSSKPVFFFNKLHLNRVSIGWKALVFGTEVLSSLLGVDHDSLNTNPEFVVFFFVHWARCKELPYFKGDNPEKNQTPKCHKIFKTSKAMCWDFFTSKWQCSDQQKTAQKVALLWA